MYELIAAELFNKPHLVEAGRLDALAAYVLSRQGFDIQVPEQPKPKAFSGSDTAVRSDNGYWIDSGIAIIDMIGTMTHRAGWMEAMSGIVSYTSIAHRFRLAMNDNQVKAIFINSDTPGGGVSGAFDLSDLIFEARNVKPVYTLASDCLCSAGILVGSSAEKIYTTQTGQIGSIGVVLKHMDISKWNAEAGINNTYIYAGDRKIDGNPDEPLSKQVKALYQAEVERIYSMFVTLMDRNTELSEQDVIETQAAVYLGSDAVDAGLAVAVTTERQLLEDMKTQYGAGRPYTPTTTTMETQTMSEATNEKDKPKASAEGKGGEAGAAAGNDTDKGKPAAEKGGATELPAAAAAAKQAKSEDDPVKAANTRFETIMNSEAAQGRHKAAVRLAAKTDMSAEDVIATLNDLPAEAKRSKLDGAMEAAGTPGIGSEAEQDEATQEEKATVSAIASGIKKHTR